MLHCEGASLHLEYWTPGLEFLSMFSPGEVHQCYLLLPHVSSSAQVLPGYEHNISKQSRSVQTDRFNHASFSSALIPNFQGCEQCNFTLGMKKINSALGSHSLFLTWQCSESTMKINKWIMSSKHLQMCSESTTACLEDVHSLAVSVHIRQHALTHSSLTMPSCYSITCPAKRHGTGSCSEIAEHVSRSNPADFWKLLHCAHLILDRFQGVVISNTWTTSFFVLTWLIVHIWTVLISVQSHHRGAQKCKTNKLSTADRNLQTPVETLSAVMLVFFDLSHTVRIPTILKDNDLPNTKTGLHSWNLFPKSWHHILHRQPNNEGC